MATCAAAAVRCSRVDCGTDPGRDGGAGRALGAVRQGCGLGHAGRVGVGPGALARRRVPERRPHHGPADGLARTHRRRAAGRVRALGRHGVRRPVGREPGPHLAAERRVGAQPRRLQRARGKHARHVDTRRRRRERRAAHAGEPGRPGHVGPALGKRASGRRARAARHAPVARRQHGLAMAGNGADRRFAAGAVAAHRRLVATGTAGLAAARVPRCRRQSDRHARQPSQAGR